jgi:DNA-binding response OmpR family regulator
MAAITLLLADDSVTIQRVIELTFATEAIRVVVAADGHIATTRLEDDRPDIVLADIGLPGVDGYQLAERIKRSDALRTVPVLLLTGAFEPVDEARARKTGCDGVLVKPFEPQRVVQLVKSLLAGHRPADLWPTDMPRVPARPAVPPRQVVAEPGPMPPPSAVEEVFEIGLDDLDLAFSRLDPVAPPSRLDADTASDFQRDIQELRSAPALDEPPPASMPKTVGPAVSHLPVEEATPIVAEDLDWDIPAPTTVIESVPVSPDFPSEVPVQPPIEPPAARQPEPPPAPEPAPAVTPELPVPVAPAPPAPPAVEPPPPAPPPTPPPPPTAPPPPPVVEPAPVATPAAPPVVEPAPPAPPPSLSAAFAALLAAEQSQPVARPSAVPPSAISDAAVEDVVRRVVTRMTDEVVRKAVMETAERLIREEIDRLNQ